MIIILEGTEAAGKTTMANYLQRQLGFEIQHRSKPKTELERRQMYQDYKDTILSRQNLIWDRCWYSEMVYGPTMRDQSFITLEQMYEYETLLNENGGALLIHCTDNIDLLWQRCQERGEDYITEKSKLIQLKHMYERLMHGVTHYIPVVRYELSKNLPKLY